MKEEESVKEIAEKKKIYQEQLQEKEQVLKKLEVSRERKRKLADQPFRSYDYQAENDFILGLQHKVIQTDQSLLKASKSLESSMRTYFSARKKRKIIESIQEKDFLEYQKRLKIREQKELDDLMTMRSRLKAPLL